MKHRLREKHNHPTNCKIVILGLKINSLNWKQKIDQLRTASGCVSKNGMLYCCTVYMDTDLSGDMIQVISWTNIFCFKKKFFLHNFINSIFLSWCTLHSIKFYEKKNSFVLRLYHRKRILALHNFCNMFPCIKCPRRTI